MKPYFFLLIISLYINNVIAQHEYKYSADLKNVQKDQVLIELKTPLVTRDTVIFSFPKAIPGSYARKDFGRFIEDFKAYSKKAKS